MKKAFLSYSAAIAIGLVAIAPPMNYSIPVMVNSFHWLYMVVASALLGFFLLRLNVHPALKVLAFYLFVSAFVSQVPYLSFNNYVLAVGTIYFFLILKDYVEFDVIINMIEAVFWLQLTISVMSWLGYDKLMNFDRAFVLDASQQIVAVGGGGNGKYTFFGTIFQYMRFGSFLTILTPFLVFKNKWYIVPVFIVAVLSTSLGFAFAIAAGVFVYAVLMSRTDLVKRYLGYNPFGWIILGLVLFVIACSWQSRGHFITEIDNGRLPAWRDIIISWFYDTRLAQTAHLQGPVCWKSIFFGHGMETFNILFPYYKHDPNPFPEAHNDWLELLWCLGISGFGIFAWYCISLTVRLYKAGCYKAIAGLVAIGVNMCFAFPWHMTQTVYTMVAFVAFCENRIAEREKLCLNKALH